MQRSRPVAQRPSNPELRRPNPEAVLLPWGQQLVRFQTEAVAVKSLNELINEKFWKVPRPACFQVVTTLLYGPFQKGQHQCLIPRKSNYHHTEANNLWRFNLVGKQE